MKAEPISVISGDYLKNAVFLKSEFNTHSRDLQVCKALWEDCESEVHINLDFRMPQMISEMAVVLVNI